MNLRTIVADVGEIHRFIRILVTGLLLGSGFVVSGLWWLSLMGTLLCIREVMVGTSGIRVVTFGVLCWFIKYIVVLSWYTSTYPLYLVDSVSPVLQFILIGWYWGTSALWLAAGGGVFFLVAYRLYQSPYISRFIWFLLVPGMWVLSELIGAYIFSIMTAGPGSLFQSYFSFGMTGYLLAETSLGLGLARLVGVYGLGLCVVGIGSAAAYILWRFPLRVGGSIAGLLIILGAAGSVWLEQSDIMNTATEPTKTVIGIDTTFVASTTSTLEGILQKQEILMTAIGAAVARKPDFIILPEESRLMTTMYAGLSPEAAMARFQFTHGNTRAVLIESGRAILPRGESVLRATIFDGQSKQVYQFDKQYLVPQGEYVPYLYGTLLRLLGYGAAVDALARESSLIPGPSIPAQAGSVPDYLPGMLFCFESVRPDGVAALAQYHDMPFVVHPISHSWFHVPTLLWHQLDIMLQVQARSQQLPIVSAGNMASGKLYLPNGDIETGTIVGGGDRYLLRAFTF